MDINKGAVGIFVALCAIGGAAGFYLTTGGGDAPAPPPAVPADVRSSAPEDSTSGPTGRDATLRRSAPARPAGAARRVAPASRAAGPLRQTTPSRSAPAVTPSQPLPPADAGAPQGNAVDEPRRADAAPPEPADPPPAPSFVELVVPAEAVIGLQVETTLTSERARVEDEVLARVTRDVRVGDRVAIPAGATAHGQVTLVERGGRLRERARLGVRFTSIVLADGTRVPLVTDTVYREGDSPGRDSAAKIGGGAIGGAIIGGIFGGAKGAAIGGSVGAGAGTAAAYAGGRSAATLPGGTPVTVRLVEPATVTVEY
ncbi:MAG: TrbI/VirB10 family protein [Acidobacteria bacterium]|nr:TrbI/VirB10 family protein [Acidobacteriota bacterium]